MLQIATIVPRANRSVRRDTDASRHHIRHDVGRSRFGIFHAALIATESVGRFLKVVTRTVRDRGLVAHVTYAEENNDRGMPGDGVIELASAVVSSTDEREDFSGVRVDCN